VGVPFGCAEGAVAEQFLDETDVGAVFKPSFVFSLNLFPNCFYQRLGALRVESAF